MKHRNENREFKFAGKKLIFRVSLFNYPFIDENKFGTEKKLFFFFFYSANTDP